jgi:hypothetical protein
VKVLPNHSLDERTIDDVENEALISAFFGGEGGPTTRVHPSPERSTGLFPRCTAPGDKYSTATTSCFPTSGVADAIVIVSDAFDMTGVGEQLRTLEQSDTGAFVQVENHEDSGSSEKTSLFMHNDLHANNNIVFNKATVMYMIDSVGRS